MKIFLSANNGRVKLAKDAFKIFKSESESKFEDIIDHLANVLSNERSQALLKQIYNIQAMDDFDIEGLVRMNFSKFVHDDRFISMLSAEKMATDLELCGCKKSLWSNRPAWDRYTFPIEAGCCKYKGGKRY